MSVLGVKTVVGVFASAGAAQDAMSALREAGLPESRIAVSTTFTEDPIGAECPGQSFENQPGQAPEAREAARFADAVRSGSCVVSVFARSDEEILYVTQLLQGKQAYRTAIHP